METITINTTAITLKISEADDYEILFEDEATGMLRAIVIEDLYIRPKSKLIKVNWKAYDVNPRGAYTNPIELAPVITSTDDYDFFLAMFGGPIKKFSLNGLFQQAMQRFNLASAAVYDQTGTLIANQPVPFPQPEDDIDISDAFTEPL